MFEYLPFDRDCPFHAVSMQVITIICHVCCEVNDSRYQKQS